MDGSGAGVVDTDVLISRLAALARRFITSLTYLELENSLRVLVLVTEIGVDVLGADELITEGKPASQCLSNDGHLTYLELAIIGTVLLGLRPLDVELVGKMELAKC